MAPSNAVPVERRARRTPMTATLRRPRSPTSITTAISIIFLLVAEPRAAQQRQRHVHRHTAAATGAALERAARRRSSRPTTTIAATSTCCSSRRAARRRSSPTGATARSAMLPRQAGLPGDGGYTAPPRPATSTRTAHRLRLRRRRTRRRSFAMSTRPRRVLGRSRARRHSQARRRCNCSTTTTTVCSICSAFTPSGPRLWRYRRHRRWVRCHVERALPARAFGHRLTSATAIAVGRRRRRWRLRRHRAVAVRPRPRSGATTQPADVARPRRCACGSTRASAIAARIGAKVELRAGSLRRSIRDVCRHAACVLRPTSCSASAPRARRCRPRALAVRDSSGRSRTPARADRTIVELDRKPSSCPFLFTWNGTRFEFVTDFMGGGEMGAWLGARRPQRPGSRRIRATAPRPARSRGTAATSCA